MRTGHTVTCSVIGRTSPLSIFFIERFDSMTIPLGVFSVFSNLIAKAADRFLPESLSEFEKADFKLKTQELLSQESVQEDSDFRKFVLDYEGAASEHGRFIKFFRATVRPVLTYTITGTYVYAFLNPITFTPEQMSTLNPATLIVLSAWFGEKILTRTGLMDVLRKKN